MGPLMVSVLLVGSGGGAAAGGAAGGGVAGGATGGGVTGEPPGGRVMVGTPGGGVTGEPPGDRVMVGRPGTAAGAAAGLSVLGKTGAGEPSEGKVSKGFSPPILMVSCACMPAGTPAHRTSMIVMIMLHRIDVRKCFGMRRCEEMQDQSTQGLRHSLESRADAAALPAMVSVFGSHFRPVLPLRRAMFARCAMVMLRCETSMGVAVGLPS